MSYVCAYSSVQLDKSRVEKEFTAELLYILFISCYKLSLLLLRGFGFDNIVLQFHIWSKHPGYAYVQQYSILLVI